MKNKSQKKEELESLKKKIPESKIIVFTTFSKEGEKGLSVSQMTELKRSLRELDSEYLIAKKTLTDMAIKNLQKPDSQGTLDIFGIEGSLGLAIGRGDDYYAVARKLYEFSKKNPSLKFSGALLHRDSEEQIFVGLDDFLEIAKMPSREVLIARLLGMLTYPMRGLVVSLNEVAKQKV